MNTKAIYMLGLLILTISCTGNGTDSYNSPNNGDLNSTFIEAAAQPVPVLSPEEQLQLEKEKLVAEGWQENYVENGQLPSCYNFSPKYKKSIDNYLEVQVGGGTDVVIKLMNYDTDKCIRYVFINSGSSYRIKNVPEGKYYVKIAYGKNWFSKAEKGQCIGKFLRNPMYEKGTDVMDFNLQHFADGYNIPSFQLQLDVITSSTANSFNSNDISEESFNL